MYLKSVLIGKSSNRLDLYDTESPALPDIEGFCPDQLKHPFLPEYFLPVDPDDSLATGRAVLELDHVDPVRQVDLPGGVKASSRS